MDGKPTSGGLQSLLIFTQQPMNNRFPEPKRGLKHRLEARQPPPKGVPCKDNIASRMTA